MRHMMINIRDMMINVYDMMINMYDMMINMRDMMINMRDSMMINTCDSMMINMMSDIFRPRAFMSPLRRAKPIPFQLQVPNHRHSFEFPPLKLRPRSCSLHNRAF